MEKSSIEKAFEKAYKLKEERKWKVIYILVDIHDTIMESNYTENAVIIYEEAIKTLQMLSDREDIILILWSSCFKEDHDYYFNLFKSKGINFKYFNTNPEIQNTTKGCFDIKPYFSVLIDDKAGFCKEDWKNIEKFYENLDNANIKTQYIAKGKI